MYEYFLNYLIYNEASSLTAARSQFKKRNKLDNIDFSILYYVQFLKILYDQFYLSKLKLYIIQDRKSHSYFLFYNTYTI